MSKSLLAGNPELPYVFSEILGKPILEARYFLGLLTDQKLPESSEELKQKIRVYIVTNAQLAPRVLDVLAEGVAEFRNLAEFLKMMYETREKYGASEAHFLIVSLRFLLGKLKRYYGPQGPTLSRRPMAEAVRLHAGADEAFEPAYKYTSTNH